MRQLAALVVAAAAVLSLAMLTVRPASAATVTPGARMLNWAKTYAAGHWYAYGTDGLSTYDCSGVVYRAALQTGVAGIPRTTYSMLGSSKLVRTYHPVAGDLAFYGSGHVEIVDRGHDVTFGAQQTGTKVGDHTWNAYWKPTAFYKVI